MPRTAPTPTRRCIHLVDIENLLGGWVTDQRTRHLVARYHSTGLIGSADLVIVAGAHRAAARWAFELLVAVHPATDSSTRNARCPPTCPRARPWPTPAKRPTRDLRPRPGRPAGRGRRSRLEQDEADALIAGGRSTPRPYTQPTSGRSGLPWPNAAAGPADRAPTGTHWPSTPSTTSARSIEHLDVYDRIRTPNRPHVLTPADRSILETAAPAVDQATSRVDPARYARLPRLHDSEARYADLVDNPTPRCVPPVRQPCQGRLMSTPSGREPPSNGRIDLDTVSPNRPGARGDPRLHRASG